MGELSELHSQEFDGWGKKSENEAAEFSLAQAVFYYLHAP